MLCKEMFLSFRPQHFKEERRLFCLRFSDINLSPGLSRPFHSVNLNFCCCFQHYEERKRKFQVESADVCLFVFKPKVHDSRIET